MTSYNYVSVRGISNMKKIQWPKNPKEREVFSYVDPIGGCSFVFFQWDGAVWNYLRTE